MEVDILEKECLNKEYSFENDDKFNRKVFAYNITKNIIFDNKDENKVIAIDSEWGTGKTQLIKMWETELKHDCFNDSEIKKENYEVIYYSAWENDDWSDAITPIIHFLKDKQSSLDRLDNQLNTLTKVSFKRLKKLFSYIIYDFVKKYLGEDATKYLVETFNDYNESLVEDTNNNLSVSQEFKDYTLAKGSLINFLKENTNKKIIFLIDELDRCKPTFAIETLEVMKHLFNIPNYIFIISVDLIQLSHSVKTVYGQEMNSEGYLYRFFDYKFKIPQPYIKDYLNQIIDDMEIKVQNNFVSHLSIIISKLEMKLRDIIVFCKHLKILTKFHYNNYVNHDSYMSYIFLVILLGIKFKSSDTYNSIINESTVEFKPNFIRLGVSKKNISLVFPLTFTFSGNFNFNTYLNTYFHEILFDKEKNHFYYLDRSGKIIVDNSINAKRNKNMVSFPDEICTIFEIKKLYMYKINEMSIGNYFERELEMFNLSAY